MVFIKPCLKERKKSVVLRKSLGAFLNPCSYPQVPRTQTSRPESPGMTSPSPRIQIISTDSAVASPQRIQVLMSVPLGFFTLSKTKPA